MKVELCRSRKILEELPATVHTDVLRMQNILDSIGWVVIEMNNKQNTFFVTL